MANYRAFGAGRVEVQFLEENLIAVIGANNSGKSSVLGGVAWLESKGVSVFR